MSNQFCERVGKNIKKYRSEKDLTLKQLAEKVGITEATMQKYERGNIKNVSVEFITKLALALNVKPEKLTGWEGQGSYADYKEIRRGEDEAMITKMHSQLTHGHKKAVRELIRNLLDSQE